MNQYLMQARDSVTGEMHRWLSAGGPDFAGSGYTGPNAPEETAVVASPGDTTGSTGGENGQYQGQLWAWDDDAQRWAPAPPGVQVGGGAGTSDRPILILDAGTDPDLGVRTAGLRFLQEGTRRAELECVGSNGAVPLNLYDAAGQLIRSAWIATASNFQILSSMLVAGSIFPSGANWDIGASSAPWRRIYAKGSYHDIRTVKTNTSRQTTDRTIVVDASSGNVTVSLGTPVNAELSGQIITVCRIDDTENSASITGMLVDGTLPAVASVALSPGDRMTFQADVQAGYWLRIAESGIEVLEASNDPPQPIGGAASAGTSDAYARADHVHTGPTTYPRNLWVNNQLTNGPPNDMVQIGENGLLGRVGNGPIQSISPGPYAILGQIGSGTPLQAITFPPNSLLIRGDGENTADNLHTVHIYEGDLLGRPVGDGLRSCAPAELGIATQSYVSDYVGSALSGISTSVNSLIASAVANAVQDGTYTPTFSNASGLTIDSVEYVRWTRLLDTVRVDMSFLIDNPGGGSGVASVDISLPVDPGSDFADDASATGHGSIAYGDSQGVTVTSVSGAKRVTATLRIGGEFPHDTRISLSFTYHISSS